MELVLCIPQTALEQTSPRSSTWSQRIAAMSRRLETRWARTDDVPIPDPFVAELLCASASARLEFELTMRELADPD
jgi:hypothetical protein